MKHKLTEITQGAHIVASPWLVGPTTPTEQTTVTLRPCHSEPPNSASKEDIEAIYASTAPPTEEEH